MREILVKTEEFKDSPLGKIPKDWGVLKIATFASIKYGINDAIDQTLESGIPTITLPCVKSSGELVLDKEVLGLTSRHKVYPDDVLQHGDLLFNWRNGSQDHLGKTAYFKASGEYTHVGFLLRIRTNPEMCNSRYLWWRLCYMKAQGFFLKAKSQVNNTFNSAELAAVNVIIPPIHEQQCIVEILDAVDEAIAHTTTLIAKLKQMKAGLLHDLLTRGLDENGELRDAIAHPEQFKDSPLGQIPKDWEVLKLESLLNGRPKNGYSPKEVNEWTGTLMLGLGCLTEEGFEPLQLKNAPSSDLKIRAALLNDGDFLLSRSNTRERVALAGIYRYVGVPCIYSDLMMRLSLNEKTCNRFLELLLRHFPVRRQLTGNAQGTSVSMVKISSQTVIETVVALPNPTEQARIIECVDTYDTRIRKEEAYREKLKLQKQGLMHDLLTGKVRVKNA